MMKGTSESAKVFALNVFELSVQQTFNNTCNVDAFFRAPI